MSSLRDSGWRFYCSGESRGILVQVELNLLVSCHYESIKLSKCFFQRIQETFKQNSVTSCEKFLFLYYKLKQIYYRSNGPMLFKSHFANTFKAESMN